MKKLATLIALLLLSWGCFAQDNGILYTDFEPDLCIETRWFGSRDTIKFDFDRDNEIDFMLELFNTREPEVWFIPLNGWEFRSKIDCTIYTPITYDTLVSTAPHGWSTTAAVHSKPSSYHLTYGVRKVVNDSIIYYGWFNFDWINASSYSNNAMGFKIYVCIDDMAYCTIPDYPLRWGQTTMTSVTENEDDSFVSLYPNPTTGIVNIKGERLRQAEIFNSLGQRIALIQCSDDEFSVDMNGLPSGLYYATITDVEGRRYTQKIVKE